MILTFFIHVRFCLFLLFGFNFIYHTLTIPPMPIIIYKFIYLLTYVFNPMTKLLNRTVCEMGLKVFEHKIGNRLRVPSAVWHKVNRAKQGSLIQVLQTRLHPSPPANPSRAVSRLQKTCDTVLGTPQPVCLLRTAQCDPYVILL